MDRRSAVTYGLFGTSHDLWGMSQPRRVPPEHAPACSHPPPGPVHDGRQGCFARSRAGITTGKQCRGTSAARGGEESTKVNRQQMMQAKDGQTTRDTRALSSLLLTDDSPHPIIQHAWALHGHRMPGPGQIGASRRPLCCLSFRTTRHVTLSLAIITGAPQYRSIATGYVRGAARERGRGPHWKEVQCQSQERASSGKSGG